MKLDSSYSWPDKVRLAWSFIITKIFFPEARLVRQPARIRGYRNMKIGKGFTTGQYCRIEAASNQSEVTLVIGEGVQINDKCHIAALQSIRIGANVLMASNVFITDHDHGRFDKDQLDVPPAKRLLVSSPVVVGDNVWLGENVVVLKGVTIGHGSIIAAGCVVVNSVPPYSLVAGVPGRVVRALG